MVALVIGTTSFLAMYNVHYIYIFIGEIKVDDNRLKSEYAVQQMHDKFIVQNLSRMSIVFKIKREVPTLFII